MGQVEQDLLLFLLFIVCGFSLIVGFAHDDRKTSLLLLVTRSRRINASEF